MTGFGQGSADGHGVRVTATLRGVNQRFADLRVRVPPQWLALEPDLRRRVLARVRRGRIELALEIERDGDAAAGPRVNRTLASSIAGAARALRDELGLPGELDLRTLLLVPGIISGQAADPAADEHVPEVAGEAVERALAAFDADRLREGRALGADLARRIARMSSLVEALRARAAQIPDQLRSRLRDRIATLLEGDVEVEPGRLAQEIAFLADRADVTEELVRLASHLDQAASLLAGAEEPVGKRLDFLLQEIQRETNTIHSKSPDLELSRLALDLKVETEKVREQVQNLE